MDVRGYRRNEDIMSIYIRFRVGSLNDITEGKNGISHFAEHLVLRKALGENNIFEKYAVHVEGGTSRHYTEYSITFHHKHYDEVTKLFLSIFEDIENITLNDMEEERKVIKNESYKKVPGLMDFSGILYDICEINHPKEVIYGNDIDRLSLDDIKAWIKKYYTYDNAQLFIIGKYLEHAISDVAMRCKAILPRGELSRINLNLDFKKRFDNKRIRHIQRKEYTHPSRMHLVYNVGQNLSKRYIQLFRIITHTMLQKYVRRRLSVYNVNTLFSTVDRFDNFISITIDTADMLAYEKIIDVLLVAIRDEIDNNLEKYIEKLEIDFCRDVMFAKEILLDMAEGAYSRFPEFESLEFTKTILKSVFDMPSCLIEVTNKKREEAKYRISYNNRMKQLKEIYS